MPIENSVEGGITTTLDELVAGAPLMIYREVLLSITFALLVRPGTKLSDVKTVSAHPAAQPQVRNWLRNNLPDAHWESAASNADAARLVQEGRTTRPSPASSPPPCTAWRPLETGIHDAENAQTRFVLVGRPARPAAPTGADKTSVVLWQRDDHPGGLRDLLERVRHPRHQPDAAAVPAHRRRHRQLLLLHRRRGPHLRPPGGRGPDGAQADLPAGAVPGFVPACGRRRRRTYARRWPGHVRRGVRRRPRTGWRAARTAVSSPAVQLPGARPASPTCRFSLSTEVIHRHASRPGDKSTTKHRPSRQIGLQALSRPPARMSPFVHPFPLGNPLERPISTRKQW